MAIMEKNQILEYKYSLTSRDSVPLVEYFAVRVHLPNSNSYPVPQQDSTAPIYFNKNDRVYRSRFLVCLQSKIQTTKTKSHLQQISNYY